MLKLKHYLKKLKTFKFTNFFNYLKVIKQRYLNKIKISENSYLLKYLRILRKHWEKVCICILILVLIIAVYFSLSYNFTLNKYNSYIKNTQASQNISVTTLGNGSMVPIYSDLKKQDYTSFIYGFNLNDKTNTYKNGEYITINMNLSSNNDLDGKIINIYSYNTTTKTFECLGEAKVYNNTLTFKVNSLGEHFITLGNAPTYDVNCGRLVYDEEFNSTSSVSNQWNYDIGNNDGWGNKEEEYYTDNIQNSNIVNGTLNITALKQNLNGYNYTSARLVSKNSYLYGKIEVCAKLPKGKGTWPAIWMLPENNTYGNWPDSGEIDIMEATQKTPNYVHGSLQMNAYNFKTGDQKTAIIKVSDLYSKYHVYGVLWTPNKIELSIDGHVYLTYDRNIYNTGSDSWKTWPYNQPFKLILNIAIGGTYGGTIDNNAFPQTMSIKYIKVYNLNLNDYNLNTITS